MQEFRILPREAPAKKIDRPAAGILLAHGQRVGKLVQVGDNRHFPDHHNLVLADQVMAGTTAFATHAAKQQGWLSELLGQAGQAIRV